MVILEEIQKALESVSEMPVYYGKTFASENDKQNYIVFNRRNVSKSGKNNCDFNYYYQVHIIHENYIPEGFEHKIVDAMEAIPGMKLTTDNHNYQYVLLNSTDTVVELLTLTFTKTVRGCKIDG